MSYTINVNGKPRTVEVEADTSLLWFSATSWN